jgi:transposase InsO family protein
VTARYEFIEEEKASFSVSSLCRALEVSGSGYYDWRSRGPSVRQRRRDDLAIKVKAVHHRSKGTYGSPRVREQLVRLGETVSEKTVAEIMQQEGLRARRRKRYKATTDSRATYRIAPNLLARNFTAEAPNQAWVTDVTAIWTWTGWVYLAAILDLFARRVVGWALSESNDTVLALAALRCAVASRQPAAGLVHHSDRGSPYGADDYIKALDEIGAVRSMSRKGDCWDNAVAESFFATLEHECLQDLTPATFLDAHRLVGGYIDGFYNPERLHSTIGFVSPVEYELLSVLRQEAA